MTGAMFRPKRQHWYTPWVMEFQKGFFQSRLFHRPGVSSSHETLQALDLTSIAGQCYHHCMSTDHCFARCVRSIRFYVQLPKCTEYLLRKVWNPILVKTSVSDFKKMKCLLGALIQKRCLQRMKITIFWDEQSIFRLQNKTTDEDLKQVSKILRYFHPMNII